MIFGNVEVKGHSSMDRRVFCGWERIVLLLIVLGEINSRIQGEDRRITTTG
jgi:hypothetical protein